MLDRFFVGQNIENNITDIQIEDLPKDMFVRIKPPVLILEKDFIENANEVLAKVIVFHELYHKFGQNMNPNMVEVKYMQDYFGPQTIIEMDIDSDVETFKFMKDSENLDFAKYLGLIYDGLNFKNDNVPRIFKVSRFLGSLISITCKSPRILYILR